MNGATALPRRSFGETMRADIWWLQPLLVFLGLSTFIVYSTWRRFRVRNYFVGIEHLAILFARTFRRFATQLVWTETWLVAVLAHSSSSRAVSLLWAPQDFA